MAHLIKMFKCVKCGCNNYLFDGWQDENADIRMCAKINCRTKHYPEIKEEEKPEMWEAKIYISFRYNPKELNAAALADEFCNSITCDGFGEITDLEIK